MRPTRADKLRHAVNERRGRIEITLVNRALRRDRTPVDRALTAVLDRVVPSVPAHPHGERRGGLDRPARDRTNDEIMREG